MQIRENERLAPFTTFGIGGPARWFAEATGEEEVAEAAAWARERGVGLFVLGGGSNLLVSDAGFDGLVLRVGLRGIETVPESGRDGGSAEAAEDGASGAEAHDDSLGPIQGLKSPTLSETIPMPGINPWPAAGVDSVQRYESVLYRAAAGEDWDGFVERTVRENCAGIECLAGIPGTVGGTPVQNVGAYGQEVASSIERVRAFDLGTSEFVEFSAVDCGFSYRRSRFNSADRGRFVVTRVDYGLTVGGKPTLLYADLQREIQKANVEGMEPSLAEVAGAVRRVRHTKGMLLVDGEPDCRSAGSFFKNPVVTEVEMVRIAECSATKPPRFPAGAGAANEGRVKVPAAWLIEQAGFSKGYAVGAAGVSSRHTLALVNRGGASAADVLVLAGEIGAAVEARFGIVLEMEPVMVGF